MNKNLFVTVEEIKTILGITGTNLDTALAMYVQAACNQVCALLGAYEIIQFAVTDEEIEAISGTLTPKNLPVDTAGITLKDSNFSAVSGNFYVKDGELRTIREKEDSGLPINICGTYFVSYTAGWLIDDVPTDLKFLVSMIVQAAILKVDRSSMSRLAGNAVETAGQLKKYQLGTKSVEYFDPNIKGGTGANATGFGAGIDFEATVKQWAGQFRKFKGFA